MRVALKQKQTERMTFSRKVKRIVVKTERKFKVLKNLDRAIHGKTEQQVWYDSIPKRLLPSRIDVYDTHVEFNRSVIVRNIVIGGQRGDAPTFGPNISSKCFEEIMKLGGTKGLKISISEKLIKKPSSKSSAELQDAFREVNVEQYKVLMDDPAGTIDLGLKKQKQDIESRHDDLWDLGENSFQSQMIITIKGTEEEVLRAESYIISKLDSEIIQYWIPEDLQFEAFLASGMFPISDPRFFIEVPSSLAAKLVAMTNINTRYDPYGLLFGVSRETGADVIKDLRKLPAKHLIMYGATGSGKTFSALILLMRMKDILNHRIVYMTRKAKDRREGAVSDYEAVARFYKEDASIFTVGKMGCNPLQLIYDEKSMIESDYEYVWNCKRKSESAFFKSWFQKDWTINMEGLLEDNLDTVYDDAKIYRNKPASWKNKSPTITNLRAIWLKMIGDKERYSAEDRRTAAAMYRKTRAAKPGGSMEYLIRDAEFQFKDWMIIDLHQVDERLQDALYILITSMLSMRFNIDSSKDTIIFVDEARALLQDRETSTFLLDGITMWRSRGVGLWLATQQPKDLQKAGLEEEMSTNMFMSLVMGAKLTPKTAGYVQKYFGLADSVVNDLLTCQQGEGILIMDEVTPIRIEPTPLEKAVIEDTYEVELPAPVGGYRLKSVYLERGMNGKNFIENHGFWLKEMIEEGDENSILADGWLKYQIPKMAGKKGSTNLYYRDGTLDFKDMLVKAEGYGKMSIDHLHVVLQKEVYITEKGFRVTANPNNYADLVFEKKCNDGKIRVYAGEYEEEGSHTKAELIEKWGRLQKYDDYRFFASDVGFLKAVGIPDKFIVKRGKPFDDWIDSLIEEDLSAPVDDFEIEKLEQNEEVSQVEMIKETQLGDLEQDDFKTESDDVENRGVLPDKVCASEVIESGEQPIGAL